MGDGAIYLSTVKGALQIRHVPLDGDYDPGGDLLGRPR